MTANGGVEAHLLSMPPAERRAFELYAGMDARARSLTALAALADMPMLRTLERWSTKYGWQRRIDDVMAAEADKLRAEAAERRGKLRGNLETGLSKLAMSYALEASGVCGICQGRKSVVADTLGGEQKLETCAACAGTGRVNPMRVNVTAMAKVIGTLEELWGRPAEETAVKDADSGISHEEFIERQQAMLRRAGIDVIGDMGGGE